MTQNYNTSYLYEPTFVLTKQLNIMQNPSQTTATQRMLKSPCINFMHAYASHDMDQMMHLCDPNGEVWFKSLGEAGRGKIGELGKAIWSGLIDCFPDIENTVHAAVTDAEGRVRCQVLISGTQAKDFADIPNKGLRFGSDHIFIFHLNEQNKIDRIQIEWDHEDLKRQLGAGR